MNFSFKAQRIATGEIFEGAAEATDKFALAHSMKLEGTLLLSAQALEGKKFSLHALVAGLFARVSLKERIFWRNVRVTMRRIASLQALASTAVRATKAKEESGLAPSAVLWLNLR